MGSLTSELGSHGNGVDLSTPAREARVRANDEARAAKRAERKHAAALFVSIVAVFVAAFHPLQDDRALLTQSRECSAVLRDMLLIHRANADGSISTDRYADGLRRLRHQELDCSWR